jgi:thioredoxin 1
MAQFNIQGRYRMANPNVLEFTDQNWEQEVIKSDKPVLVDFWAPWCGPCRQLIPIMEKLADRYAGRAKIGKLNIDDSQEVSVKYGISGIPVVLVFKTGEEKEKLTMVQREEVYAQALDRLLQA